MNLHYLKSRVRLYQQARSQEEREQSLYHLARHLNLVQAGQTVSRQQRDLIFAQLRQMGLTVGNHTDKRLMTYSSNSGLKR